jgi:hypothetical protein
MVRMAPRPTRVARFSRFRLGALLLSLSLTTCSGGADGPGGSGGGTLDCAWLASNNCWKTTVAKAVACLPDAAARGTLDASNAMCTYASGQVVTFTPALVLPSPLSPKWNFTVTKAGSPCLHYEDTSAGFKVTVGSETVTEAPSGAFGLAIKCPDGMTYSAANAFELLDCGTDGGLLDLPGNAWASTDTSVGISLIGTIADGQPVFSCAK